MSTTPEEITDRSASETAISSESRPPVTTTISTIAVQSGNTRIVIALLQSKEWMQLKIQEMYPAMTEIGNTVEEALEFHQQHELVLEKLQTKQSPVEELLRQADELISNQQPRAEVYSAMAENLGLAWKDLNAQLEQRRQILEQAVAFHNRASEFSERMERSQKSFTDTYLPSDAETCRTLIQRHHDEKKALLEASMHTLNESQLLLEKLREVATHSMGDSRPAHMQHAAKQTCFKVEQLMESLHDKRKHLEAVWLQRKTKLEQCLQMCLVNNDLNQVQNWLRTKGADYIRQKNLGDSSASAEILQHEHTKMEGEAKEIQDKAIKLLRTCEQLSNSGHYLGEELKARAYEILEECSEFLSALESRRLLLSMSVSFFNQAQTALNKLDQIEVQLTTTEVPRSSAAAAQQHSQLAHAIEEITVPALQEGYTLLDRAGRNDVGSQGIARKVTELEERQQYLSGMCTAHRQENLERTAAFTNFYDKYNPLHNWILNVGHASLQGHQDMGSILAMAKDFLKHHEKLQNDTRMKGMEVEALLSIVPSLLRAGGEEAEQVHQKAESLRYNWSQLQSHLDNRIRIAQRYVAFHNLAVKLANNMDGLEESMRNERETVTERSLKQLEERWLSVQQEYLQFNNTGKNFIEDARKLDEPYLDTNRAILCVETLLEHFQTRKNNLATLWANWQSQLTAGKEQILQWEHFVKDAQKIIDSVSKVEDGLFPVIPKEMNKAETIAAFLEKHNEVILSLFKTAQSEAEGYIKKAEVAVLKGDAQVQRNNLIEKLHRIHQHFQNKMAECQVLISMMITFFRNFQELEKHVRMQEMQYKTALLPPEVSKVETLIHEHEASKPTVLELFKFTNTEAEHLTNKITEIEPVSASIQDKDKVKSIIQNEIRIFEETWHIHKERLEQHLQLCLFNQDLHLINQQIGELNAHLASFRGNYGDSLSAATTTSQSFTQFEQTIKLLQQRFTHFVSTAEKMMQDQHIDTILIQKEIHNLQTKWSTFHTEIGHNRQLIDLSVEYFKLVEEAEEWYKEGSRVLITVARKSTSCKSPQDAGSLLNEVENFLKSGEAKQEERIRKISSLSAQLYGGLPEKNLQQVSGKNKEMLDSFTVISHELVTLGDNLKAADQDRIKQQKEKEEADAVLKAAQAEAAAAKAAATAAQEAAKAAEAAAKAVPVVPAERILVVKEEAVQFTPEPMEIELPQPPPPFRKAPMFIVPLADAEVVEGSKYTFECRVEGFPEPSIQWYKDGLLVQNNPDYQTTYVNGLCTLTIEETFTEDSARFTCKASNEQGVAETHGRLTVIESSPHDGLIPPHFTKELEPGTVQEGKSFHFECQVAGNPLPLVSWFKNDVCIDNSPDYSITYNNGFCVLKMEEAYLEDEARYTCRAANQAGQVACSAKLSVQSLEPAEQPTFIVPLSNVMARAGQKLRLECQVKGHPEPQITWLHNNKPLKETRDIKLHFDGDKATLVITEAFPKDAGTYSATAKNQAGEATTSCSVSVKGRLPLETSDSEMASDMEPAKPLVKQHLKDITVAEGNRVRFDCIIVGQPEPEVIWYHNGKPVKESDDFQLLFEGDRCSLIIKEAYLEDAGFYKCTAINSGGEASSQCCLSIESLSEIEDKKEIILTVEKTVPPKFIKLLSDINVFEGQPVKMECCVTGEPEPCLTWHKNGRQIDSSSDYQIIRDKNGVASLSIPEVFQEDGGSYVICATNKAGEAKCYCTLSVLPKKTPPQIPPKPAAAEIPPHFQKYLQDVRVLKGNEARFECCVTGTPKPKITWTLKGVTIGDDKGYKITEDGDKHCLSISSTSPHQMGRYSITAENNAGKAISSALLTVEEPFQEQMLWDGFQEERVQSMVMKKTVMQTSTISQAKELHEKGSFELHQISSQEDHAYRQAHGQPPEIYHDIQMIKSHQFDDGVPQKAVTTSPLISTAYVPVQPSPVHTVQKITEIQATPLPPPPPPSVQTSIIVQKMPPEIPIKPVKVIPPKFLKPVTSALVEEGEKILLEGEIEGHPEPSVKWFKNGIEICTKPGMAISFSGAKATLFITKATDKDSGKYTCTASNSAGSASSTAEVVVKPHHQPPKFTKRLQANLVKSGDRVHLEVEMTGIPTPQVKWYRNNILLENSPDFRITVQDTKHSLLIPEVFPEDSGKLMVVATNIAGEAQCIADLIVEDESPEEEKTVTYKEISTVERKKEFFTTISVSKTTGPEPYLIPSEVEPAYQLPMPIAPPSPKPVPPVQAKLWTTQKPEPQPPPKTAPTVIELPPPPPEPIHVSPSPPVPSPVLFPKPVDKPSEFKLPTSQHLPPVGMQYPEPSPVFGESSVLEKGEEEEVTVHKQTLHRLPEPKPLPKQTIFGTIVGAKIPEPVPHAPKERDKIEISETKQELIKQKPIEHVVEFVQPLITDNIVETIPQLPISSPTVQSECQAESFKEDFSLPSAISAPKYPGPPPPPPPVPTKVVYKTESSPLYSVPIWKSGAEAQPPAKPSWKPVQPPSLIQQKEMTSAVSQILPISAYDKFHDIQPTHTFVQETEKSVVSISSTVMSTTELHSYSAVTTGSGSSAVTVPEVSTVHHIPVQQKETEPPPELKDVKVPPKPPPKPIIKKGHLPEEAVSDTPKPKKEVVIEEGPVVGAEVQPPVFSKPLTDVTVKEREYVTLECHVEGIPVPTIRWFSDHKQIVASVDYQITFEDGVCLLVIPEAFPEDTGKYTCTATNIAGSRATSSFLTVESVDQGMVIQPISTTRRPVNATPPTFEKPPTGGHFIEGGDAHFECKVRGNPTPEVVWSRRGMPIKNDHKRQVSYNPETGNCFFHIKGLTAEDDGDYTCTAVNCAGEASLTVTIHRGIGGQVGTQEMFRTERIEKAGKETIQHKVMGTFVQSHMERHMDGGYQRTLSSDYEVDSSAPMYYSGTEGFRVDTFEYRLLREVEFRELLLKRQVGETEEPQPQLDTAQPLSAPLIQTRPRNSKLLEGSDATFQAKISGNPRPRITWFKNGQRIVPSQRYKISYVDNIAMLHIHMCLPEDAGYYTLLVDNKSGLVACSSHLVIEAIGVVSDTRYSSLQRVESAASQRIEPSQAKPARTTSLENDVDAGSSRTLKPNFIRVPKDKEVTEGKMVRFDCCVSGRPVPEILWYHNGNQVIDDATHKLLVNEGGVHALMITVTSRTDAGSYTCIARNKSGEIQFTVNLTVIEKEQVVAPKFVERFQSMHVKEGEPATLHCRAVATPVPNITWQKDGVQIHSQPPNMIIETIEGSSTLYFNRVAIIDSAWYQCTAQNQAGSTATRARLYVDADVAPTSEPWRLTLPRPQKVIAPEGSPPRETIWLKPVERAIPKPRQEEEPRPPQKPAFTTHLQDLILQEGDRANFDARLLPIGDPTMTIEWFVNGKPVEASSRIMTIYRFGYVALTLLHVYPEDSGVYMCRATNEAGEATTTATLKCSPRATIERSPQHPESLEAIQHLEYSETYKRQESIEEIQSVQKPVFIRPLNNLENLQEGGFAHFEAQITPVNDPTMKVEWFFNGESLRAGTRLSTTFSFGYVALNISYLRAEDSGVYMCKATNSKGEAMSTATLKITVLGHVTGDLGIPEQERYIEKTQELEAYQLQQKQQYVVEVEQVTQQKPYFRSQLIDQSNIQEGRIAHFEARLEPTGDSTMRVEWLKDGKPVEASSRTTAFFNFGYVSLTIRGVETRDVGTYTCCATNRLGSATSSAKLTCISKKSLVLDTQYPEGLEKIQHLEDTSRYQREVVEETTYTQRPSFTAPLQGKDQLVEGQSAHFETRLEPMGDPSMVVEWYFNGRPLTTGHRFRTYFDFGYVALDILYVFPEDTGTFKVVAKNAMGESSLTKQVTVQAKSSVDTTAIHEIVEKIEYLERPPHLEPQYSIEEMSKSKPNFTIPLHDPKPLKEGERVHLECRLEPVGDPTMKVEWYFNGKPLQTGHRFVTYFEFGLLTLDILTAYPEDTGEYTVRATNHLGSSHTSACIKVIGKGAVLVESQYPEGLEKIQRLEDSSRYKRELYEETVITQMPTFTKPLHNIETVEGTNIHLECRLTPIGDPTMKVEWYVNGIALKVGHRFRPAYEFDYVALDILSVYPEDSGVYTCKAISSNGQAVTSCTVKCIAKSQIISESQHPEGLQKIQHLEDSSRYQRDTWVEESVKVQPRFLTQLVNLQLREGQLAHFECRLEPINDSTLKVEWFRNGKTLPVGHRYRPFHDFGYVALNILSVVPEDSGTYTCRATNMLGSVEISATLSCQGKSAIISETQHPEGLEKIQQLEDYSRYSHEKYVEEVFTQAPVFTSAPRSVEIKEGQRVHFECRLIPVGDPKLKVEWFHNGQPIKTGTRFVETFSFGFVALDILYANAEDSGTYTCKAINALGEAVTSVTLKCTSKSSLILEPQQPDSLEKIYQLEDASRYRTSTYIEEVTTQAPVFTHPMHNLDLVENQSAHFECRLIPVGDPKLKVEWFFNGRPLMTATRVTTTHDFGFVALDLSYVKPEDSGIYTCKATNDLGQAVCSSTLTVKGSSSLLLDTQHPEGLQKIQYLEDTTRYQRGTTEEIRVTSKPVFVSPLTGPQKLTEGQSCHFECRVEPYPDPTMKVEWFFNGKPLQTGHRFRTRTDFGFVALDILTVLEEDSGEYIIKVTNQLGSATASIKIQVIAKDSLILESQQPESLEKIQQLESRTRRTVEEEVIIDQKPAFGRPLQNLDKLIEGQTAHLEATLTPVNDPHMKVEWFFNGRPIQHGHRFKTTCDFGYVALDILYVFEEDSGTYMCKATNRAGEAVTTCSIRVQAKSSIYTETLHKEGLEKIMELERTYKVEAEEPTITVSRPIFLTPLTSQENIKEGQPVHLECKLEPINDPKLKVEWFINGIEIKTGHRFKKTHDFGYVALDILYSFAEDSGTYMCKATNELGEAVTTCSVKVQAKRSIYYDTQHPEGLEKIRELECQTKYGISEVEERPISRPFFKTELRGITNLNEGDNAHFECHVEPAHDSQLKIEFFHNGKPLAAAARFHITFDFGYVALDISHVLPEDQGTYTAKATNSLGEAVSSITIRVLGKSGVILDTQHPEGLAKIQVLEDQSRFRQEEFVEKRTFQRPVFTAPLQNLDNLIEGQSAHFECRLIPVGDPTLKVEWFFNEKPLQMSSRFQMSHDFGYVALEIQYVRPDDTGFYMCRASNDLGEAVTTASVKVKSKTSIELGTQHPEGLEKIQELESAKVYQGPATPDKVYEKPVFTTPLMGPNELVEGQPAHFECRVVPVGDPDLHIEWFVNGVELTKGSRFQVMHDFGMVSMDIVSTIPEDSGIYMCKATNKAGEAVTSTSIKVKARHSILGESRHPETYKQTQKFEYDASRIPEVWMEPTAPKMPVFIQHLTSQEKLAEGQYVHLDARVEPASDEKLRVEWYKNGKPLVFGTRIRTTFDFGLVSLDIVSVRPDDSGIYTCRAVNEVGEAISTCTIKVEGREGIILGSQHPESLHKIQELEAYQVAAVPERSEPVYESPVFVTHLNNIELQEGQPAHFECRVEPAKDPTLTIEFLVNGKPIPAATRFTVSNDFGYVTLDISSAYSDDAGIYTCKATNKKGQAVTTGSLKVHGKGGGVVASTQHPMGQEGLSRVQEVEEAYMAKYQPYDEEAETQYPKPVFVRPLQAHFTINEGDGLRLECQVEPSTDPRLCIEWFFNGKSLSLGTRFMLTNNDFGQVVLEVSDLWGRDSGVYTCRAYNLVGEAFTSTTIQVTAKSTVYEGTLHPEGEKGLESIQVLEDSLIRPTEGILPDEEGHPPVFTSQFQNLTNLNEGDIAHFEATLTPAGDQTMVVEWFFKGQPLKAGHRIRTVHAFGMVVLEILGVYPEDSGEYTCRATNKWGIAEITVILECIDRSRGQKPHFTTQLQTLRGLKEGDSAHFECTLIPVGDPTLKVEWFHNGKPMRDSSRIKTLSDFGYVVMDISFVHVEDNGEYVCKATNKFGFDSTRCVLECTGFGKVFRETLQPQSLEKIAELEGSQALYRSQISVDATVNQPPHFTTHIQPLDNLAEGQSAHFEAHLTPINDPNLTVEWYFNGKPLRAGHRFRTFHDFGIVILDILYCYGEDSGEYVCKAVNRFGSDITKTTLRCKSKSSIILEPQLPVEMAGGNERIMQLEDSLYRSRSAIITELQLEAPRFTVPLENLPNMREGENAHFEARLVPTDDPELTVEWFKNGKPLRAGTRIRTIHDFGFVVLEISPVYPEDSGVYSCRAFNRIGEAVTTCTMKCEGKRSIILETQLPESMETSIEKIARLEELASSRVSEKWMDVDISQPPIFITQPQDQTLPENSLAHFECRLTPVGDPTMKVEWFHNGKPLVTGSRIKTISDFGFVILEVAGVYTRDAGVYTCRATNKNGEASVSAKLTVKSKQSIIMEPQLPQEWRSGTESLQRLEEALYHTEEVILDEEKNQPPTFITQIQDLDNKTEGDSAHFECRLIPVGDPTMRVEWFQNGKPLITGTRVHTVDDFGFVVLEIDWIFPRDAGEYLCRATNKWGSDTTKAVLKIRSKRDIIMESQLPSGMSADKLRDLEYPSPEAEPSEEEPLQPPRFITQIQPQDLHEGDSAHFECRLEPVNDPKLRVEWYHNGKPLRSGHRFKTTHDFGFVALDVLYVYPEDAGEYSAHAVNDLGEDLTKTTLKIKAKPHLEYRTQLPKEMEGGVQKIAEMESSWQRVEVEEEMPKERSAPVFIMRPEPQVVIEGEWAKFQCRVIGNPKPRIMWVLNGNTVITGSRYKLTYDGIYHLDIPKSRQYDHGKVEVYARNFCGEAYCWTTLEVRPRHDDYRVVLKNSPRPWYDTEVKVYQKQRHEMELEKIFEEKLTPGGTKLDVWHTKEDTEGDHVKLRKRVEEEELKKLQPEVKRYKTDAVYFDPVTGEKHVEEGQSQVQYMAKTFESIAAIDSQTIPHIPQSPTSPESVVYGKEIHTSKQKQTQKEQKGDLEVTRHTTVTETMEQEHKGVTKERKIIGVAPETKPPMFTKKIQPCRAFEGESAKFECVFTGLPTPTVTWYRENFPITSSQDFKILSTDTTSTVIIREVYLEDSGVFSVKAENRGGSAKSSANLVVEERREQKRGGVVPPSFSRTIQDCSVKAGQLVRLDAKMTGSKPLDVYWLKNGKKLLPDITHKMLEEDDQHTFLVLEASPEDAGSYECVAINQAGEARCQAVVHLEAPSPRDKAPTAEERAKDTKSPEVIDPLKDITVKESQPAMFRCKVTGSPVPQVKWFRGDSLVKQSRYFRMSAEKDIYTLRISEAFPEDEGVYKCVASNPAGTVTTSASLRVIVPEVTEIPPSVSPLADLTVPEGAPARFVTTVTGTPTPKITWYREGAAIKPSRDFQMFQDGASSSLVIRQTYPEDEGIYTCRATNASGQAETSARLTVESKH